MYYTDKMRDGEILTPAEESRLELVQGQQQRINETLMGGKFGVDSFTVDQYRMLREQLAIMGLEHPEAEVVGHSTLDPGRSCPNFDVQSFLHHPELFEGREI